VRARVVAGDDAMVESFEAVRRDTLARPRDAEAVRGDVAAMRSRMRGELDRSTAARFDLKQGDGGLVDLEFLVQCRVLQAAHAHPALLEPRSTLQLLAAVEAADLLNAGDRIALEAAHAALLAIGLDCMLDRRPRIAPPSDALEAARETIRRVTRWP